MYIQELTIEIKSGIDRNQLVDEFLSLLYSLRKSGQSQSDQEASFLEKAFIKCYILTLEKNSLDKKYNTEWVTQQLEKLETQCLSKLQVKTLGTTYENYAGACKCKRPDFLILFTHLLNDAGPLDCGSCFKPVPLYKLVQLSQVIRQEMLSWEENYISCDKLQISSTVGEKWATKQMTNHDSQLSKQGISLCSKIEELTGISTYYYLFNYCKLTVEKDKKRSCPSCGQQWLLNKQLNNIYDFKCDNCKLISSITSNGH